MVWQAPQEPAREVTLYEVAQLPMRSAVAFAARCARRLQPCLQIPDDTPDRHAYLSAVDAAIGLAEQFARATAADASATGTAATRAYEVGEVTGEYTGHAAYAAGHAAQAARLAIESDTAETHDNYMEAIASAYGASRVLQSNVDTFLLNMVLAALRADYDKLVSLALGTQTQMGQPLEPSEAGPLGTLWPLGSPWEA